MIQKTQLTKHFNSQSCSSLQIQASSCDKSQKKTIAPDSQRKAHFDDVQIKYMVVKSQLAQKVNQQIIKTMHYLSEKNQELLRNSLVKSNLVSEDLDLNNQSLMSVEKSEQNNEEIQKYLNLDMDQEMNSKEQGFR